MNLLELSDAIRNKTAIIKLIYCRAHEMTTIKFCIRELHIGHATLTVVDYGHTVGALELTGKCSILRCVNLYVAPEGTKSQSV